jgi:Di-haem cytochrome c peroxidase
VTVHLLRIANVVRCKNSGLAYIAGLLFLLLSAHAIFAQDEVAELSTFDKRSLRLSSEVPGPEANPATPDRVELGPMPFFDPRFSSSDWLSCATCHNPSLGWPDGLSTGIGDGIRVLERRTPSIVRIQFLSNAGRQGLESGRTSLGARARSHGNAWLAGANLGKAQIDARISRISLKSLFRRSHRQGHRGTGDESAVSPSAKRGFASSLEKRTALPATREATLQIRVLTICV